VLSADGVELKAVTQDVSASGVLFELDCPLRVGQEIRFSVQMPRVVLGSSHDILVHCLGRVVRCCEGSSHFLAASTIDDYEFAEPERLPMVLGQ
jgi:hypothetical protein